MPYQPRAGSSAGATLADLGQSWERALRARRLSPNTIDIYNKERSRCATYC
ncbi:MAG: hypothetical protein M3Z04_01155 [Chloroflexota bacterium]|nr:hypothetical protein [Chloroflexota bacterium]